MNSFFIDDKFKTNLDPEFYDASLNRGTVFQYDVYNLAILIANTNHKIIDAGCGDFMKLLPFLYNNMEVIGIDLKKNIEFAKQKFVNNINFIEHDLETGLPSFFDLQFDSNDLIICADVIEHLVDPTKLLFDLKATECKIVISTPDRKSCRNDVKVPINKCHVREWSFEEFSKLIESFNFKIHFMGYTANRYNTNNRHQFHTMTMVIN